MSRHNFRAAPCREVNNIQSYSIYKDNKPFIRPADGQIIDRSFASKLVELCTLHFASENKWPDRSEARSAGGDHGGPNTPPTGAVAVEHLVNAK